jgi:FkbM family methyltransferase
VKKGIAAGTVALVAFAAYALRDSKLILFLRLTPARHASCGLAAAWNGIEARRALWERIGQINDESEKLETDPARFELIRSGDRRWWVPRRNRLALAEMLGEQEAEVYGAQGAGVRAGDVVLDCGANVGVFTRHALDRGARKVVAIEPAPENLECLRRNFASEIADGRVIVYPKGVWSRDQEITIRTFDAESGGDSVALRFPGSREGPRVALTTIDKLAAELQLDRVDFIKMDIEGAEREALVGAVETVARFRPRMVISLEHQPDDYEAIRGIMSRLWPDMKYSCGPCTWVRTALINRIQPEELYVSR